MRALFNNVNCILKEEDSCCFKSSLTCECHFIVGEVFVLDDGGEVDLDLGNYERFLDIRLTKDNNLTTGKIYQYVINKERKGDYLGKTVQGNIMEIDSAYFDTWEDVSIFSLSCSLGSKPFRALWVRTTGSILYCAQK